VLSSAMALRLRPQKRVSPVYRDLADYAVLSRELVIGRIYEDRTAPDDLRWYWTLNGVHAPMVVTTSGKVATLEQAKAKAQLAAQWQKWLDWAGLQEVEPTPKARLRNRGQGDGRAIPVSPPPALSTAHQRRPNLGHGRGCAGATCWRCPKRSHCNSTGNVQPS